MTIEQEILTKYLKYWDSQILKGDFDVRLRNFYHEFLIDIEKIDAHNKICNAGGIRGILHRNGLVRYWSKDNILQLFGRFDPYNDKFKLKIFLASHARNNASIY